MPTYFTTRLSASALGLFSYVLFVSTMSKKAKQRSRGYQTEEFFGFYSSTTRSTYTPNQTEFVPLLPRNPQQVEALKHLRSKTLTFLTGPPGTSKTLLSVFVGCEKLRDHTIDKIYYVKPVVDVPGEKGLGFLPGSLNEKIEPHIAPVKDALNIFTSKGKADYMLSKQQIEFVPIEHLRGRSLNRCMIIADEMQNATTHSVMTILSRLGDGSSMCILGDTVQRDLATRYGRDGLSDAIYRLKRLEQVGHVDFSFENIERSDFVKQVICAYADLYGQ